MKVVEISFWQKPQIHFVRNTRAALRLRRALRDRQKAVEIFTEKEFQQSEYV